MRSINLNFNQKTSLLFKALVFFTLILYLSPQSYFASLSKLHLAKVSALFAISCLFFRKDEKLKLQNDIELYIFLLLIWTILTIPFSSWKGGSFRFLLDVYLKVIILFFLLSRSLKSEKEIKIMIFIIVGCCVYFAIIAIWNYTHSVYAKSWRIGGPKGGIARDPNDLALTLVTTVPLAVAMYELSKKKLKKIFYFSAIFLMIAGIVVSFSRGGFLGITAVLCAYILKRKRGSKIKAVITIVIILVPTFYIILPASYIERISTIWHTDSDSVGSAQARLGDIKDSMIAAIKRPLFGYGLAMNTLALQDVRERKYWGGVHSAPLQVLSELGILALILYIIILYKIIKTLRVIENQSKENPSNQIELILAKNLEPAIWGFIASGFFLPVAYRWYLYYLAGITSSLYIYARSRKIKP